MCRTVAEERKTDPLLRAANWMLVIYPFYNLAGCLERMAFCAETGQFLAIRHVVEGSVDAGD